MKKGKAMRPPTPDYNYGLTRLKQPVRGPSMTKQSEAAATDINNILRKYDRTGVISHLQKAQGVFADVSEIGSYMEAVQTVHDASEAFSGLPSGLRAHFGNDPARYIDWAVSASPEDREALYTQITGKSRDQDANPTASTAPASSPADQPETGD